MSESHFLPRFEHNRQTCAVKIGFILDNNLQRVNFAQRPLKSGAELNNETTVGVLDVLVAEPDGKSDGA